MKSRVRLVELAAHARAYGEARNTGRIGSSVRECRERRRLRHRTVNDR